MAHPIHAKIPIDKSYIDYVGTLKPLNQHLQLILNLQLIIMVTSVKYLTPEILPSSVPHTTLLIISASYC